MATTVTNTSGDILYVYSKEDAGGFALGYMWPDGELPGEFDDPGFTPGTTYTMCGTTSDLYFAVDYWGTTGFVPAACASMVPPP